MQWVLGVAPGDRVAPAQTFFCHRYGAGVGGQAPCLTPSLIPAHRSRSIDTCGLNKEEAGPEAQLLKVGVPTKFKG